MTHDTIRQAGDVTASAGAVLVALGHWANALTPILTFLIAVATLGWWIIRYAEWIGKRRDKP